MENLLEIRNLSVEFITEEGNFQAVKNISFALEKGKTLGIVGESGSGKSVTSLALMGLIPQPPGKITSGEILFAEDSQPVDLLKISKEELRKYRGNKIAMIFQEPMTSLNPVKRCGEQVLEAIILHQKLSKKEAKKKVISLFKEVLLPNPETSYKKYPHQLSGGQKQRVMIAMAISCNPLLLIADEPTTALDVTVQKTILELLKNLQIKYGMSIIFITHDLGVIAEIADNIGVMFKGELVEYGSVKDILNNPSNPYTAGLIACRPQPGKRFVKLPTVTEFLNSDKSAAEVLANVKTISTEQRAENHNLIYSKQPVLEIKNLNTWFQVKKGIFSKPDFFKAVDGISFEVYPGETLGLVGESGCGKTTLGRTILRLVDSTSGQMTYKGIEINQLKGEELRNLRKNMQIIFQDPYSSLNPRITVGSAILEPMQVHGIWQNQKQRKEKVMDLLTKVGLMESHFSRYPHEFSGGQRQRVCIARALAVNPEFIICDESVSALDVSVQAQVLNLLNDLKTDFGFTYIFISHDLSVVKFMSDRLIVMNKGKIVEMGDSDLIYSNPQSEYTRNLIDAIPKIT